MKTYLIITHKIETVTMIYYDDTMHNKISEKFNKMKSKIRNWD